MNYLSPKALTATGIIAFSFLFLSYAHNWFGLSFWVVVILLTSYFALRFAPRIGDITKTRSVITVPFFISIVGFLSLYVLVEQAQVRWVIAVLSLFVVFVSLNTLYKSEVPDEFRARRLVPTMRMAMYAGLYCLFASIFGIIVFLKLPIWIFALIIALATGLVGWSLLHFAGIKKSVIAPAALVVSLLAFELFWVNSFLPFGYAVQGWLLTCALYAMIQGVAFSMHPTGRLKKRSQNRFILAIVSILVVAIVSRWV